eukprot:gene205-653_t
MKNALLLAATLPSAAVAQNWLLQCSPCVDQALFSDADHKSNIQAADLRGLYSQIKQMPLSMYDNSDDEFYNKFFSRQQLGVIAQDLQKSLPIAVGKVPERRWVAANGTTQVTKNTLLVRESYILMAGIGALQHLMSNYEELSDTWRNDRQIMNSTFTRMDHAIETLSKEAEFNRAKREEIIEKLITAIVTAEVLQKSMARMEGKYEQFDAQIQRIKVDRDEDNNKALALADQFRESFKLATSNHEDLVAELAGQNTSTQSQLDLFQKTLEKEAHADLVEKRRIKEVEFEISLVKMQHDQANHENKKDEIELEEQKKKEFDERQARINADRIELEAAKRKEHDLLMVSENEESANRQEKIKAAHEKERLKLKLSADLEKAKLDNERAEKTAKVDAEARIREIRENEDVHMREQEAAAKLATEGRIAQIREVASTISQWFGNFYQNPKQVFYGIAMVAAAAACIYLARELAILLREQLNKRLGRPSLVRQTNRKTMMGDVARFFGRIFGLYRTGHQFDDVVLNDRLSKQILRLAKATQGAKKRGANLLHVMFYGPPGTGKTMTAMRFAEYSGLEYAIMSGGDVAPLEEQSVTELHKLFKWINRSRKGVLLFIDEADAFLMSRDKEGMSENIRNALSTMLFHTGTPSQQFMLVLATNRPHDLDHAILDRIDEAVEFGLPDYRERERMLDLYYRKTIVPLGFAFPKKFSAQVMATVNASSPKINPSKAVKVVSTGPASAKNSGKIISQNGFTYNDLTRITEEASDEIPDNSMSSGHSSKNSADKAAGADQGLNLTTEDFASAARRISGFSGREIAKMFSSLQTHVYDYNANSRKNNVLPKKVFFDVIDAKVIEHKSTEGMRKDGYVYSREFSAGGGTNASRPNSPALKGTVMGSELSQIPQNEAFVHESVDAIACPETLSSETGGEVDCDVVFQSQSRGEVSTLQSFLTRSDTSDGTVVSCTYHSAKVADLNSANGVRLGTVVNFQNGSVGVVTSFGSKNANVVFLSPGAANSGDQVTCSGDVLNLDVSYLNDVNVRKSVAEVLTAGREKSIFSLPKAPLLTQRKAVGDRIETGIHALEWLYPLAHGQRMLLIGEKSTGKSTLCANIAKTSGAKVVYSSIAKKHTHYPFTIAFNANPSTGSLLETYLSPLVAYKAAEQLRNAGENVILVLDDLEQHTVLGQELEKLSGCLPFSPSVITQSILDSAGNTKNGSLTVIAIANLNDDLSPSMKKIETELSSIVDLKISFDAQKADKGFYPAIDFKNFPSVSPVLHHQHSGIRTLGKLSRFKLTEALQNETAMEMKKGLKRFVDFSEQEERQSLDAFQKMFSQRRNYSLAETYVIFQAANFFYFVGREPTSDAVAEFQEQVLALIKNNASDTFNEIDELLSNPADEVTYDYLARVNEALQVVFLDHRFTFDMVRPDDRFLNLD